MSEEREREKDGVEEEQRSANDSGTRQRQSSADEKEKDRDRARANPLHALRRIDLLLLHCQLLLLRGLPGLDWLRLLRLHLHLQLRGLVDLWHVAASAGAEPEIQEVGAVVAHHAPAEHAASEQQTWPNGRIA